MCVSHLATPDLQAVDPPVGVCKGTWLISDIVDASRCHIITARIAPNITGPTTAESDVKDDFVVLEEVIDDTVARELTSWRAPVDRLRVVPDIAWNLIARPEPNLDGPLSPFHSVDTTTAIVEVITIGVTAVVKNGTPLIVGLVGSTGIAVGALNIAG